jgi:transposase-like protein
MRLGGEKSTSLMQTSHGAVATEINARPPETQRAQRRRFSTADKLRIVCDADACPAGTIGAFLRREGIYSSQLYAWRRQRDHDELDRGATPKRAQAKNEAQARALRNAELERENRKLRRRLARAELISDNSEKSCGAHGNRPHEPRGRRGCAVRAALELAQDTP